MEKLTKMNPLKRALSSIRRAFKRDGAQAPPPVRIGQPPVLQHAARPRHVEPDVPIDQLERAYMPPQTSFKASFRTDGSDRQRDQELIPGYTDERFSNEDLFTNKSGDPRIGTHGRRYEPGERRQHQRR
jgi:hypothetical protein